jgi:hypothetical protein
LSYTGKYRGKLAQSEIFVCCHYTNAAFRGTACRIRTDVSSLALK